MKFIKTFCVYALLLVLVVPAQLSAQTTEIIWSNMQESYKTFEDVAPVVENQSKTSIYYGFAPFYNRLLRYDDNGKQWVEGNYTLSCGTGFDFSAQELESGEKIPVMFFWRQFFDYDKSPKQSFVSKKRVNYLADGKYKIRFYFDFDKSSLEKLETVTFADSPEFTVMHEQK